MTTEFSTELTTFGSEGRPAGGPPPMRGINIKRLIRLQLLPMILIAAVIAIPTVALVWLLVPVTYSASAQIHYQVDTATLIDSDTLNRDQLTRYMNDQVRLVTSATILSRVKQQVDVAKIPWVAAAVGDLEPLRKTIDARIIPGTNMLDITVTADASAHARSIINAVIQEYKSEVATKKGEETTQALATLREDMQAKSADLEEKEREIALMTSTLDAPIISNGRSATMESYMANLAAAESALTTAQTELRYAEAELADAKSFQEQARTKPNEPIYAFNIENQIMGDVTVQLLRNNIAEAERNITLDEQRYQPNNSRLVTARDNLKALKSQLAAAEARVRTELIEGVVATTERSIQTIQARVADAEEQKGKFQALIDENTDSEIKVSQDIYKIEQLERESGELRENISRIRDDIDEIVRVSRAPARLQLVGDAEASNKPNHGDRIKLSLACIVAACGAAGMFGLFREFTDQTVRTPQDLSFVTSLPLLASIPHTDDDRLPTEANATTLAADHAISATADEFRRILTRIIYPPEGAAELNTCLIVSPSRGDGKTSMAANLAIALAQANRRVLLLDISARHPSIEKCFGMEPAEGLSEVLCERANPAELIRVGELPNLHVMGPGFLREALVGKLASRDVVEFLERAEEEYEHVIIDTPPSLLMSDAKLLAPIVDGVIVVCGVGKSSLGMLRRCIGDLQNIGANVIGIVLNGIRAQRGGYMRKNVALYYDYPHGRAENGHRPLTAGRPASGHANGNGNGLFPSEDGEGESGELPMIVVVDHPGGEDDPRAHA